MILRIDLQLTGDDVVILAGRARGYFREEPRKAWKEDEYKEAARLRVEQIVRDELLKHGKGV